MNRDNGATHELMRTVRDRGGVVDQCASRYDHDRGGRVVTVIAFYPGMIGYPPGVGPIPVTPPAKDASSPTTGRNTMSDETILYTDGGIDACGGEWVRSIVQRVDHYPGNREEPPEDVSTFLLRLAGRDGEGEPTVIETELAGALLLELAPVVARRLVSDQRVFGADAFMVRQAADALERVATVNREKPTEDPF